MARRKWDNLTVTDIELACNITDETTADDRPLFADYAQLYLDSLVRRLRKMSQILFYLMNVRPYLIICKVIGRVIKRFGICTLYGSFGPVVALANHWP